MNGQTHPALSGRAAGRDALNKNNMMEGKTMKLWPHGMYLVHGKPQEAAPAGVSEAEARRGHHRLGHPGSAQHQRRYGRPAHEVRLDDQPRHHLRGHHPDGAGLRHGAVPAALRHDQLPQQPVRGGRHHQRGRPPVRPLGGAQVRRYLRAAEHGGHPQL